MPTSTKLKNSNPRPAGVFCPVSAWPSRDGIGDFSGARPWLDWLAAAGQRYWQVLPLTIPDHVGSPYASASAMAGNWLLIDLEDLYRRGWLPASARSRGAVSANPVHYRSVYFDKRRRLKLSYQEFLHRAKPSEIRAWRAYCRQERDWLDEAAWFFALKARYRQRPWWTWPAPQRTIATADLSDPRLRREFDFETYLQWIFSRQWSAVRAAARAANIKIIGDTPFYQPLDSVEVWARPKYFLLNRRYQPTVVAGVPPDPFNRLGQRWGNPVYHWPAHRADHFAWWTARFRLAHGRYDIVRIDHFRGLDSTWHIPVRARGAKHGYWVATPGADILRQLHRRIPGLKILAEDLGQYSARAEALRQTWSIEGVRVWQFGWNGLPRNIHHPRYLQPDVYYYTSTHDTNTLTGWWRNETRPWERQHVRGHLGSVTAKTIAKQALLDVYRSQAAVAMTTVPDILGLGQSARLNRPGQPRGNWTWRFMFSRLTPGAALRLRKLATSVRRRRRR